MPVAWMPRKQAEPVGPRPPEEALDQFQVFFNATTYEEATEAFDKVLSVLDLRPGRFHEFFPKLKLAMKAHLPFKYKEIWNILDKKSKLKTYASIADKQSVLVVGAGPCGLRAAVETQLMGAKTVVIEKRTGFTRNNVLKLWKFLIDDLKLLGAKKIYGKFASGNINHIGIKTLQLILYKVCLMLGVEIVAPCGLVEMSEPDDNGKKWTAVTQPTHPSVGNLEFDMIIIASGKKVAIEGFDRRSLDAKLSIAVTANFQITGTPEEAAVRQISGIAKQFHQQFFKDLETEKGIALENIVYYRGGTHYFVMTALRKSLIDRGVILEDNEDRKALLAPSNIDRDKLHQFAIDAAQFSTASFSSQLPDLDFALDARGNPDVACFDFTNLYSARNASRVMVRKGHQLLMAIVGDSLLEPFWPEGTGCARGFLSSLDAAWLLRQWVMARRNPLDIIAERENIYRLLSQTADGAGGGLKDAYKSYTIDPSTRYRQISKKIDHERILPLYDTDAPEELQFLKDKFLNQQFYSKEEHKTVLQKFRKGAMKKGRAGMMMPIRVARAFRNRTAASRAANAAASDAKPPATT